MKLEAKYRLLVTPGFEINWDTGELEEHNLYLPQKKNRFSIFWHDLLYRSTPSRSNAENVIENDKRMEKVKRNKSYIPM